MSVIGSNILAGASGQGGDYTIARSLRLRSSASAYLSRTPASAGNRQVWTWSAWVKRGQIPNDTSQYSMLSSGGEGGDVIMFSDGNKFTVNIGLLGINAGVVPTQVQRDPSAWYHLVVAIDTTQGTASNRVKMYVNNVQITSFSTTNYPSQNTNTTINSTTEQAIGRQTAYGNYFDGYMTEVNFIDGQALTPSDFGSTNASTGVWQPISYAGTYGTNGFYLPFTNNSTTTTLGSDFSGNGNNWTTNNISLTAGSTYDSMTDVPTLTSATAANYCVWNPLDTGSSSMTASNGNLTFTKAGANFSPIRGTLAVISGKYYFEMTANTSALTQIGVCNDYNIRQNGGDNSIQNTGGIGAAWDSRGFLFQAGTSSSYAYTFTTNDVVMVAFDASSGKVWFGKNGTWNTGNPATDTSPAVTASGYNYLTPYGNGESGGSGSTNFGQRPFAYTPPTGFVALNTFNLPTPTIGATASTLAEKYMDISLYSGTSASGNNITDGLSLSSGGLLWVKNRNATGNHALVDSVRGITKRLISDSTNAEDTVSAVTSFNANGFTLQGSDGSFNLSGRTYVGWQWLANGTGVTNTAGSITSTVSANTSAGFSVVTYTGTGANATFGHGLGVAPSFFLIKTRSTSDFWVAKSSTFTVNQYLLLNSTNAVDSSAGYFNSTAPTSSVISLGSDTRVNGNGTTYVSYCWSEVAGYSKFGSYVGNGSTDGTFVHTGFRPKFILFKRADVSGQNWRIQDTTRNTFNTSDLALYPNSSGAEDSGFAIDFLSNGFKLRGTDSGSNASGSTYVYACFAENPYKYSLAR
jgi:hypothetical protein